MLHAEHLFIDSTHVKASANKRKYDKKVVRKETRAYEEKLPLEVNMDREEHGKKPFPWRSLKRKNGKKQRADIEVCDNDEGRISPI